MKSGRQGSRWVVVLAFVAWTAGCAGAGGAAPRQETGRISIESVGVQDVELYAPATESEHLIPHTEAEVWPHMRAAFEELGVEVTEVKENQWIIGNPRFRPRRIQGDRLSTFLECGRDHGGAYADQYDVQVTFMAQLLRGPDQSTQLTVLVTGTATPRSVSGSALPCTSKRVLEERLAAAVEARLPG